MAAKDIHRNRLAHIRRRGQHRRGADQGAHALAPGICAAYMARQHGDHIFARIVHHDHPRILVLAAQMRGDQAHHGAERDEEHQLVMLGEQARNLVLQRAGVDMDRIGQPGEHLAKLGGGADMRRRQMLRPAAGQLQRLRRAVFGDGDQCYTHLLLGDRRGRSDNLVIRAHAATPARSFFRHPLIRSPRTRCGCLMIISER